jgi:hypothetical protein
MLKSNSKAFFFKSFRGKSFCAFPISDRPDDQGYLEERDSGFLCPNKACPPLLFRLRPGVVAW